MKTKLILSEDLPALGHTGDVVEVSSGYARNFLLPRGLALPYSDDAVRRLEKARIVAEEHRAAIRSDMEALSKRLSSVQLTFEENASKTGHLYGAVTAKRISEALAEQGLDVPEAHVRLSEPIRDTGEYAVPLHVHADIDTEIQVWVVSLTPAPAAEEGDEASAEAAAENGGEEAAEDAGETAESGSAGS